MFGLTKIRTLEFNGSTICYREADHGKIVVREAEFSTASHYIADYWTLGCLLRDIFRELEAGRHRWVFPTLLVCDPGKRMTSDDRQRLSELLKELGVWKVQFS